MGPPQLPIFSGPCNSLLKKYSKLTNIQLLPAFKLGSRNPCLNYGKWSDYQDFKIIPRNPSPQRAYLP